MHPLIVLWSHPRSMSTATERIMRERGDCTCFHEPFMYDYYVHRAVREMPMMDVEPDRPQSYGEIRDMLLDAAEAGPVFVKDMSYYVVPQMFDDRAFAERITHSFLIRDPLKSIVSYHRLDSDLSCEEIGLSAQWTHFTWLREMFGIEAPVLNAETVQAAPQATIDAWWREIGLEPCAHAFDWTSEDAPDDWGQVEGWHGKVMQSTGIRPPARESADERRAAFEAAADQTPHLRDYLAHHQPCFEALDRLALTPDTG